MSNPTLPGDIPGLLRRGSPVRHEGRLYVVALMCAAEAAAKLGMPQQVWISVCDTATEPVVDLVDCGALALDLTDATGRAHAAWWLHSWAMKQPRYVKAAIDNAMGLWVHAGWTSSDRRVLWEDLDEWFSFDFDCEDPRLLPDRSHWVDAEALRLVCLHVAGLLS